MTWYVIIIIIIIIHAKIKVTLSQKCCRSLYKQQMSHICSHSNSYSYNWCSHVRSSLNSSVFICRLNAMYDVEKQFLMYWPVYRFQMWGIYENHLYDSCLLIHVVLICRFWWSLMVFPLTTLPMLSTTILCTSHMSYEALSVTFNIHFAFCCWLFFKISLTSIFRFFF